MDGIVITNFTKAQMRPGRTRMQMIYQDPYGSLNPRMKVGSIIGELQRVNGQAKNKAVYNQGIAELMSLVDLLANVTDRYSHEFSGGQRQRIVGGAAHQQPGGGNVSQ